MSYVPRPVIVGSARKRDKRVPEPLPSAPFALTVVAPRMSGKTALICGLVRDIYRRVFNTIVIASPTAHLDETYRCLGRYPNVGFTESVSNVVLEAIMDEQKEVFKNDPKSTMLLYIDDAGDYFRRAQAQKLLNVLFSTGRHPGISLCVCVQHPTHLSSIQKSNTQQWIVFRCDRKAMLNLAEQLQTTHMYADELFDWLMEATEKRFSFAYIDLTQSEKHLIYRKGFE